MVLHGLVRRARTLGALVRDPEGGFETQALLLCTDLNADLWEILRRFVMRWQLEVTFQEVCRHLGFDLVRRRPNRKPGTSPSSGPQSIATSESWACRRSSGCRKDRPRPPPPPGAALLLALLWERNQRVYYVPGLSVDRARDTYRGESNTDARDAHVIAYPRRE